MNDPVVLVTGGSGFLGSWVLRDLLNHEARVIALDLQPATERWRRVIGPRDRDVVFSDCAIIDRDGLESLMRYHGVTQVIHLAALLTPACQDDPFLGCRTNVLGSAAVFDAARRAGSVKAIAVASSYAVYGNNDPSSAIGADEPPMFYGAFKQAVDGMAVQYAKHFGLRSLAIRPHVIYGPEREQGLTAGPSLACRAAARGESYVMNYSGMAGYDYVEDVARAFVRGVMECPPGFHIVDLPSQPATPEEIIQIIEHVAPGACQRISVSGPPIPPNIPPVLRDIRQLLPEWRPTSLTEGISRTVDYYRNIGGGV